MEDPAAEAAFESFVQGAGWQGLGDLTATSGGAARRSLPLWRSCSPLVGGAAVGIALPLLLGAEVALGVVVEGPDAEDPPVVAVNDQFGDLLAPAVRSWRSPGASPEAQAGYWRQQRVLLRAGASFGRIWRSVPRPPGTTVSPPKTSGCMSGTLGDLTGLIVKILDGTLTQEKAEVMLNCW